MFPNVASPAGRVVAIVLETIGAGKPRRMVWRNAPPWR
jgi:hypothetical protein